ncbi:MAG: hypothetical protein H7329_19155 [Opitutaceae bacterium]|nr:hypothetical protein [Cytophagales bacterium]
MKSFNLSILLIFLLSIVHSNAQTLYVPSGTAGIGTSSTTGVGIGTGTNAVGVNLQVMGNSPVSLISSSNTATGSSLGMAISDCNGCYGIESGNAIIYGLRTKKLYISSGGLWNSTRGDMVFQAGFGNPIVYMTLLGATGQLGIGTTCIPSDGKLGVNGKIYATALQLKLTDGGGCFFPDYVFASDYKLSPLSEVEKYVQKNKHLEGIPTAKEVETNGINVAELSAKMLEKIEELTLYLIELKKENTELKLQNKELERNFIATDGKMDNLTKQVNAFINNQKNK